MPRVDFHALPDHARLWVFAASDPVTGEPAARLLSAVDEWLAQWKAHGDPLTCGRDWRDDRFLAIGVDQSAAGASGCSVDALFHVLQHLQSSLGTTFLGGARVFWRDGAGAIVTASRDAFAAQAAAGAVGATTPVFDTSVTTAAAWRAGFERPAGDSWHRDLLPAVPRA